MQTALSPYFPMSRFRSSKGLCVFLIAVLFTQLSFQLIHVFTAHTSNDPYTAEHAFEAQIDEASSLCGECTQFLFHNLFFVPVMLVLSGALFPSNIKVLKDRFSHSESRTSLHLRGPPIYQL